MGTRGPISKKSLQKRVFPPGVPPPPHWLTPEAVAEYKRVAKLLGEAGEGFIQKTDLAVLASYAQAYADVERLTEEVRQEGEVLYSVKGGSYVNPRYNVLASAYNRLESCSKRLGFAPADRGRMDSPTQQPENPLLRLLGGKKEDEKPAAKPARGKRKPA